MTRRLAALLAGSSLLVSASVFVPSAACAGSRDAFSSRPSPTFSSSASGLGSTRTTSTASSLAQSRSSVRGFGSTRLTSTRSEKQPQHVASRVPSHAFPLPAHASGAVHPDHAEKLESFKAAYDAVRETPTPEKTRELGVAYAKLFSATVPGANATGNDVPKTMETDARYRVARALSRQLQRRDAAKDALIRGPGLIARENAENELEGMAENIDQRSQLLGKMVTMHPEAAATYEREHPVGGWARPTQTVSYAEWINGPREKAVFARAVAAKLPDSHPEKAAFLRDAQQYDSTANEHQAVYTRHEQQKEIDNRPVNRVVNRIVDASFEGKGGPFGKVVMVVAGIHGLVRHGAYP